jgi:hypothetical protein
MLKQGLEVALLEDRILLVGCESSIPFRMVATIPSRSCDHLFPEPLAIKLKIGRKRLTKMPNN